MLFPGLDVILLPETVLMRAGFYHMIEKMLRFVLFLYLIEIED